MRHIALALLIFTVSCHAGKNTALTPTLSQPGKTLIEQNFEGGAIEKPWLAAKGEWQVTGGVIVGKEKAEDKHAGVLALSLPSRDSAIQFSLALDGAKGFDLSYNHPKGHLFRVSIHKEGVILRTDGDKKDKSIRPVELGRAAAKFAPGQWVTLLVEVKGDRVCVQTDNGVKIEGSHPRLAMEKVNYRFVTRGASVRIDDLKISEAR